MDAPVSAFAMYKANTSANKIKKNKKRKKTVVKGNSALLVTGSDEKSKEIALKLKQQQSKGKVTGLNLKKKIFMKKPMNIPSHLQRRCNKLPELPRIISSTDQQITHALGKQALVNGSKPQSNKESDDSFDFVPVTTDSVEEAFKIFKWMIAPYNPDEFLKNVWEKKPLHISRKTPNYYKELITTPAIDDMLRNESIHFTKNMDVTSYVDGKKETHNPEGRAHPHLVWDFYLRGCSIRLLNPQTYIPKLHLLNATMQEFFNSFVGANAYLTPPDSQGFAPHYDDIEAFILQTEGKKHWRVYKPPSKEEILARVSSKNFNQDEIGEPILEVTLEPGDMLYFPRGYIHQGVTVQGEHSLHLTISMYQKHAWGDLLEKLVPAALQMAINDNVELRRGLPFDIYDNFGLVHSDSNTPRRKEIKDIIESLFNKIKKYLPFDEGVDQMHKNYQHAALPPVLHDAEKAVTVFGDSDVMIKNGVVTNRVEIGLDTRIRLLRKNILRMVTEEKIRIYYYVENSLEYHGNELPYIEIEEDLAPAIETLITSYPDYVSVEQLDLPLDSNKLDIADALWSRGLIMTEYPLENIDD